MKKILAAAFAFFVVVTVAAQSDSVWLFAYFKNNGQDGLHFASSTDGLKWEALKNDSSFLKPTVSGDKLMRDPCILRGQDGKFHMVWTVSWNERGIGYASSDDLVHWSEQQFIPVMMHEDSARNCWAPEITWDKKKKKYMIYWATTIRGKYPEDPNVESGYNHRMYYVTTSDFKKFSKTRVLYDKGFNVIDASILPVGKKYVMFLKDETRNPPQKNIRVTFSKKLTGGYAAPSAPITGNYWAEGPTALVKDGQWIVYFDKYRNHTYGAVSSDDLLHWTDISSAISIPSGLRHGTIFRVTRAEYERLIQ